MIATILAVAAFIASVVWAFRELHRPGPPRETRLLCLLGIMIALAIAAGGAMTGGA